MDIDRSFSWVVNTPGYRVALDAVHDPETDTSIAVGNLVEVTGRPPRHLVAAVESTGVDPASLRMSREYRPFDEPALYRRFARLPRPLLEHEVAVLAFVDRWGPLTGEPAVTHTVRDMKESSEHLPDIETPIEDDLPRFYTWGPGIAELPLELRAVARPAAPHFVGEALARWDTQSLLLSGLISIWDSVRGRPDSELVHVLPAATVPQSNRATARRARRYLAAAVTDRLSATCEGVLDNDAGGILLRPNNLLGAMWLQFADAIERGVDYGRCQVCDDDFELADGRSKRRKYCSNACSQRAYRERGSR